MREAHAMCLDPRRGCHHPEWLRDFEQNAERRPLMEDVIQFWQRWHAAYGCLPPGLATRDGTVIDGNHRFAAVGLLWCNEVESRDGVWIVTGGVMLLKRSK